MRSLVETYVRANCSALWIRAIEHEEVIEQLVHMCNGRGWEIGYWDAAAGFKGSDKLIAQRNAADAAKEPKWYDKKPLNLIEDMATLAAKTEATRTLFIFKNFHRREFIDNPAILQAVLNSIVAGKSRSPSWCFIVLSPDVKIPREWENDFLVVEHELPDREALWKLAERQAEPGELPEEEDAKQRMLDAAVGLSNRAAEAAFGISLARKQPFSPAIIQDLKKQEVSRRGLLSIYDGDDTFESMGGIDNFKRYTMRLLNRPRGGNPLLYPKGLLLLGIPGSGKSQAVKCLGNAVQRPVLSLDMGALRSKFQGETDQNTRDALKIADAMAPCILFIDEIEKGLSGVESSGFTDGGTGSRMLGTLLTWLNDHKSDVFFVGTCNDISALMRSNPEFTRAERFDGMFFFDLPSESEREAIWKIYIKMFEIQKPPPMAKLLELSAQWTGAEIRTCCRLSAVLEQSIEDTSSTIVPIITTAPKRLAELRNWASGRCISSSEAGLFKAVTKREDTITDNSAVFAAKKKLTGAASAVVRE